MESFERWNWLRSMNIRIHPWVFTHKSSQGMPISFPLLKTYLAEVEESKARVVINQSESSRPNLNPLPFVNFLSNNNNQPQSYKIPSDTMSSTQKLITTLQSSPYYADVQKLQTDHLASIQASIAQIHNPISTYREAVRSGSTMRVQEYQATIDAYVREVVELHEEEKRRWDIVMERLAEDVGGRLGRVLTEVMREMNGRGGECMGREMNLEGVVAEVAEKMDLEK